MKSSVENIAIVVRNQFEQKNIRRQKLAKLYSIYNTNVDAELFVTHAVSLFPNLNCGLASVYLQSLLGGEVVQGFFLDNHHSFLLLNDDRIVDITSDQYGGPRIYVGELKLPWKRK